MLKTKTKLPTEIRYIAILIFVYHTGASFIWPVYMPYMTHKLGISVTAGGTLLSLHYAMQFVGNVVGGILFDRWKAKTTIALSSLVPMLATLVMGFGGGVPAYVACFMPLGFFSGFFYAIANAWAIRLWPSGGRSNANMVYISLNVANAVGTALGGMAAAISYSFTFWSNAIFHVVFLILFFVYFGSRSLASPVRKKDKKQNPKKGLTAPSQAKWVALGLLSTGIMVTWFMYMQWLTIIPDIFQKLDLPSYSYNLLWTINAVIVVLAQPLVTWLIGKWRLTLKAQLLWGGFIFVVSSLLTANAGAYAGFVVSMTIMTIAEMLVWPSVPALAANYSAPGQEGFVQGLIAGGPTAGRVLGPFIGAMLLERTGPSTSLYASTAFSALGVICFVIFIILTKRSKLPHSQMASEAKSAGL